MGMRVEALKGYLEVDSEWKSIRIGSAFWVEVGVEAHSEVHLGGSAFWAEVGVEVYSQWKWIRSGSGFGQWKYYVRVDTQKIELQNPLDYKPNPKSKYLSYKCHKLSHHINVTNSVII